MIRFAQDTPQDSLKARKIWEDCFGDPPEFTQWYFREVYQPENTLFYEVGGQLASNLQIRFFNLCLNGIPVKAGYLAGVATYPQFRKQGYSRALIQKSFAHILANGANYCFLVPTSFAFYEQFGFAACYNKTLCTIDPKELPRPASCLWKSTDTGSGMLLNSARNSFLQDCNGYVLRSLKDWNIFLQDNLHNVKADCRFFRIGDDSGYYIARAKDDSLFVSEYGYTSPFIASRLLEQISLAGQNMRTIEILVPPKDSPYSNFFGLRGTYDTQPYAMARILSAEDALTLCARNFSGSVCIGVKDSVIAENNGIFHIQNHTVTRDGTPDIFLDISTLTKLVWGYTDITSAYNMGLIKGTIQKAEGLFLPQNNFLDNSILAF